MSLRYRKLSYTGVGSRKTPPEVLVYMEELALVLGEKGVTLRTGGAPGADSAFERGADAAEGRKEVYLPWKGFGERDDPEDHVLRLEVPAGRDALRMASKVHPMWLACSPAARKLHARNVLQVLGSELSDPSSFVICWTRDGKAVGGTRTAIVLARKVGVPVFNLASRDWTLMEILRKTVVRKNDG